MEQTFRVRVVRQEKGAYTLRRDDTEQLGEVSGSFRHAAVSPADYPTVGDYVTATWPEDGSPCIISGIFPRKSVFLRKAAGRPQEEQAAAANIDTVFLCMSLNRDFNLRRLERYLAAAWESGAAPVIVLTKADLLPDPSDLLAQIGQVAPGVDIVLTSSLLADIDGIRKYLQPGQTAAFVGSSGVGKSSLINCLTGSSSLKTQQIREDDDKGRHTTTRRQLIPLANGACVIDTPGMRELGMLNSEDGIETAFADIEALVRCCRFSDCSHSGEPGCAVARELDEGRLSPERWQSYRKLQQENLANSADARKLKNEKFKQIARINRQRSR